MAKKKRKPSKYNKHIAREMKAGKTMKQAAASWNKKTGKPRKKTTKKKTTRKKTTRRKTPRRLPTRPQSLGPFPLLAGFFGGLKMRIQNRPKIFR